MKLVHSAFITLLLAFPAHADTLPAKPAAPSGGMTTNSKQPIDITADQTLEWHRNDQQYVANGHVIAVQGTTTVKADKMVADYRPKDGKENGTGPIYRLTGTGHVILLSQDGNQAFGDKVVYDVDAATGVLTGAHLLATTPDQTVTARDNFIYNSDTGQLTANGAARLVRPNENGQGNDVITSDTMSAWFVHPDAAVPAATDKVAAGGTNKRHLDHMTADKNVVITTPTEIMHGDHATYDTATQIAIITGAVRIDRGPNVMTGDKATVNMATNVSQMIADPKSGHPVHALFYPGTSDTSDPVNVSHGDTGSPPAQSAASPGDVYRAIPAATAEPPLTAANAADADSTTPLPAPRIGAH